jgi:predicted DNA-binding protein
MSKPKKAASPPKPVSLSVPLSPETHRKLIEEAEKDGRPKANLARVLIEEGLERRTVAA